MYQLENNPLSNTDELLGVDELVHKKITDKKVMEYMSEFFPVTEDMSAAQKKNNLILLNDMKRRCFDAPDLKGIGNNAHRFVNAVSDFATHAEPIRKAKNYRENLFLKTVEGLSSIDEQERITIRQRQREGIEASKKSGIYLGRPQIFQMLVEEYSNNKKMRNILKTICKS